MYEVILNISVSCDNVFDSQYDITKIKNQDSAEIVKLLKDYIKDGDYAYLDINYVTLFNYETEDYE